MINHSQVNYLIYSYKYKINKIKRKTLRIKISFVRDYDAQQFYEIINNCS